MKRIKNQIQDQPAAPVGTVRSLPLVVFGEVRVELKGGEPSCDICMPRAWDLIGDDGFRATKLFYHGLPALRSDPSRTL